MIGQKNILKWVDNNVNSFPHFIVLVGSRGSGKRTLCKTIAHKISSTYTECEIAVDAVREVIDTSYGSHTKVMYCFADADNMRPQAKNAMLKITEEPPENAYFCLTVCDSGTLLDTIKSRAYIINIEEYISSDIGEYSVDKYNSAYKGTLNYFKTFCTTPGEVDLLQSYEPKDFVNYVELVVDNIAQVEPANAFKSSSKLSLGKEDGYDLLLFFKTFIKICEMRIEKNPVYYAKGILATEKYLKFVERQGVNRKQLYDSWVFEIRNVWIESE